MPAHKDTSVDARDNAHYGSGMSGALRLLALLGIFALAVVALSVVLGIMPLSIFADVTMQIGAVAGILGAAVVAAWALMQTGGPR